MFKFTTALNACCREELSTTTSMMYGSLCLKLLGKVIAFMLRFINPSFIFKLSVFDFLSVLKRVKAEDGQQTPILDSDTLTVSYIIILILQLSVCLFVRPSVRKVSLEAI